MKRSKKYFSLIRAGMLDGLQFRLGTFVTILGNVIYLIIVFFLWRAIYRSAGTDVVNGMTFNDTMIYLVLASALFYFMEVYLVWMMSGDIQSGKIILDLIKPMSYRRYLFFANSGGLVMSFFTTFVPTAILVYIVTHGAIHLGTNLLVFACSVALGLTINFCIDFFVGTICFFTESCWGINIMKEVVVGLLSGSVIPLAFFPETLRQVTMFLPFQAIYNTPLRLLISYDMGAGERLQMLGVQCLWVIGLLLLTGLFWRFAIKRVTVNGG